MLAAILAVALPAPARALSAPRLHECQHPVRTGVEVYDLHNITPRAACPPALALFAWETTGAAHARALYGCTRPRPEAAGRPFLRLSSFRGWALSLSGPNRDFTMRRGGRSFALTGTDFPLNCT